jgi:hypothetical protein
VTFHHDVEEKRLHIRGRRRNALIAQAHLLSHSFRVRGRLWKRQYEEQTAAKQVAVDARAQAAANGISSNDLAKEQKAREDAYEMDPLAAEAKKKAKYGANLIYELSDRKQYKDVTYAKTRAHERTHRIMYQHRMNVARSYQHVTHLPAVICSLVCILPFIHRIYIPSSHTLCHHA